MRYRLQGCGGIEEDVVRFKAGSRGGDIEVPYSRTFWNIQEYSEIFRNILKYRRWGSDLLIFTIMAGEDDRGS